MRCPEAEGLRDDIPRRIEALRRELYRAGIDACLILQKVDLYYLSGTAQDGCLYVDQKRTMLFVKRHAPRARQESPLEVFPIGSLKDLPGLLPPVEALGLELDVIPVRLFEQLRGLFPRARFSDVSPIVLGLRARKSPWEVSMVKRACWIAAKAYEVVPEVLKEGTTELEVAGEMVKRAMALGHQDFLRMRGFNQEAHSWHVLSGESGAVLSAIDAPMGGWGPSPAYPMGASRRRIGRKEPVLIDFSTCYWGYHSDQTRCYSLGPLPDRLKEAYGLCLEILRVLEREARPGRSCHDLYVLARRIAEERGVEDFFMGPKGYQTRFIGHGIGLEISEPPYIALGHPYPLQEGTTLCLEPKMVFPGLGAVGIENTYLVTDGGLEPLTRLPEEILELGG